MLSDGVDDVDADADLESLLANGHAVHAHARRSMVAKESRGTRIYPLILAFWTILLIIWTSANYFSDTLTHWTRAPFHGKATIGNDRRNGTIVVVPFAPLPPPSPSVSSQSRSHWCPRDQCVRTPQGDFPACCAQHYVDFTALLSQPGNHSYGNLPSYNLCPLPHDYWPYEPNNEGDLHGGQYRESYPSLMIPALGHRLVILETRYSYTDGLFRILAFYIETDLTDYQKKSGRVYWREDQYRDKIESLRPSLSCRYWIDNSYVSLPTDSVINHGDNGFLFYCPYPRHPQLPPSQSMNFTMWVDYEYNGPMISPVSVNDIDAHVSLSVSLSLCPLYRPVVDFAWCCKGLQGWMVGIHALEAILYQHSLSIDRFIVFDDDGTHRDMLGPLVNQGLVDYIHSPMFYSKQQLNFLQNSQYEICRSRHWFSARNIIFADTDELIVFNQRSLSQLPGKSFRGRPGIDESELPIYDIRHFQSLVQNMPENRQSWLVGVTLEHCAAIQLDGDHQNGTLQSTRFPWCNRYYQHGKWWARPLDECRTGSHEPNCENKHHTYRFERMDQAMMVHYRSALGSRDDYQGGDVSVQVDGIIDGVRKQGELLNISLEQYE